MSTSDTAESQVTHRWRRRQSPRRPIPLNPQQSIIWALQAISHPDVPLDIILQHTTEDHNFRRSTSPSSSEAPVRTPDPLYHPAGRSISIPPPETHPTPRRKPPSLQGGEEVSGSDHMGIPHPAGNGAASHATLSCHCLFNLL